MSAKVALFSVLFCFGLQKATIHAQKSRLLTSKCDMAYDGIDLKTKKYRSETMPAPWFEYTPSELKNQLRENDLMECTAQVALLGDKYFINLNIQINSMIAEKEYGSIERGNILQILFVDGKEITLKGRNASQGILNQQRNGYVYAVAYTLPENHFKKLRSIEVDKIGIQWSSGLEKYVIYELDLIMNQLNCIINKRENKTRS